MKKLVMMLLGLVFMFAGCTNESAYNEQVERYEKLVLEEVAKKVEKLDEEAVDNLRSSIYKVDADIKELEDDIVKDGKISKSELESYSEAIDKVEDIVNEYK